MTGPYSIKDAGPEDSATGAESLASAGLEDSVTGARPEDSVKREDLVMKGAISLNNAGVLGIKSAGSVKNEDFFQNCRFDESSEFDKRRRFGEN